MKISYLTSIATFFFFNLLCGHGFEGDTLVFGDKESCELAHITKYSSKKNYIILGYDFLSRQHVTTQVQSAAIAVSNCYVKIHFDEQGGDYLVCTPSQEFYVVRKQRFVSVFDCVLKMNCLGLRVQF